MSLFVNANLFVVAALVLDAFVVLAAACDGLRDKCYSSSLYPEWHDVTDGHSKFYDRWHVVKQTSGGCVTLGVIWAISGGMLFAANLEILKIVSGQSVVAVASFIAWHWSYPPKHWGRNWVHVLRKNSTDLVIALTSKLSKLFQSKAAKRRMERRRRNRQPPEPRA